MILDINYCIVQSRQVKYYFRLLSLKRYVQVYDLTFFCALPPESRSMWAKRMKEIIEPGGELVTVVFPIGDYVCLFSWYLLAISHFLNIYRRVDLLMQ